MLSVVRRGAATREKPPETVRGLFTRLPWAWDGLCFAVPFNDPTLDSTRDLVSFKAPSAVGSTIWTRDQRGNTALNLAPPSYIEYADYPAHNRPSTELTAYVRLRQAGTPTTYGGIFTKRFQDTDPYTSWAIEYDLTEPGVAGAIQVDGVRYEWSPVAAVIPTAEWTSVFLRWRSGTAPRLDLLGERGNALYSDTYPGAVTGSLTYSAGKPLRINASEDPAENFNADYSQALLWSRRLNDAEVQALVADPFGWYSPRRETVGVSSPYPPFGGQSFMREVSSG